MRREHSTQTPRPRPSGAVGLCLGVVIALLVAATPSSAQDAGSYGYFRTLEGSASVLPVGADQAAELAVNQPILTGDRILVDAGSRLEVVLPDTSRLRLDGGADLTLSALANSGDEASDTTQLTLTDGLIQLVVPEAVQTETRIDTGNATAYVREPGTYRIEARGVRSTEVTVRQGSLEVLTRRGSSLVRQGDAIRIEGDDWPQETLVDAGPEAALERWGDQLEAEIARAQVPSAVDDGLAYAAEPLDQYGDWMDVNGRTAWRPRVSAGWSPYSDGRWAYTPSGLTWVSYESWGWLPYHYGAWDLVPYYGWVWYPGSVYAPAWVYWYWGPSYVGWCPIGFYTSFYGPRYARFGLAFRWGDYGWIGGDWGLYNHWNFVPTRYFGARDLDRRVHNGAWITREHGRVAMQRGLLTTDTTALTRSDLHNPEHAVQVITDRAAETRPGTTTGGNLPDATAFVARRDTLGGALEHQIFTRDSQHRVIAPPTRAVASRPQGQRASSVSVTPGSGVRSPAGESFAPVDVTDGGGRTAVGVSGTASTWRGSDRRVVRGGVSGGTVSIVKPTLPNRQPRAARPPIGTTDEALAPNVTLPRNNAELARPVLDRPLLNRPQIQRPVVPERGNSPLTTVTPNNWRTGGASVRTVPVPGGVSAPSSDRVPVVRRVIDGMRSIAPVPGGSRVTGRSLSPGSGPSAPSRSVTPHTVSPRPAPHSSSAVQGRASNRSSSSSPHGAAHGRAAASRSRGHR